MNVDLFAGVGGFEEALRQLAWDEPSLGIEIVPESAAVAEEAGHSRLVADIRNVEPRDIAYERVTLLTGAPPCQTFSAAGQGGGRPGINHLVRALMRVALGESVPTAVKAGGFDGTDPRSHLTLEPMRFIRDLQPTWIAFEEVKEVLPVWEAYQVPLQHMGYQSWAGVLNAADYGLPQTRKRAFLLARKGTSPVYRPWPTHSRHGDWGLFDSRAPWVTMAEALDWTAEDCRASNLMAPKEAHDLQKCLWPLTRPATTVVRSFRPDVIAAPGYRQKGDPSRQNAPGSVVVNIDELKILMGVRSDFPIETAPLSKQRSLLGGILPPSWAAQVLAALL